MKKIALFLLLATAYAPDVTAMLKSGKHFDTKKTDAERILDANIKKLLLTKECENCFLYSAYLKGMDLEGSQLPGANLRAANLRGANFSGANLSNADLSEANLKNVNFSGANLSDSDLSHANLDGANLKSTKLTGSLRHNTYYGSRSTNYATNPWCNYIFPTPFD